MPTAQLLTMNSEANEDLIANINTLLSNCSKKQLKQIYDMILIITRK